MVGSAKRALLKVLPLRPVTIDQFVTLVTMIEGLLNTRPLSYVSDDVGDPQVLCPNDFLIGRTSNKLQPFSEAEWSNASKLKYLHEVLDIYWLRFKKEIVPQMNSLNKLTRPQENLKTGDIVAILEGRRGNWPLGLVTEVKPGKDGKVRVVSVRTGNGQKERPISELMLLLKSEVDAKIKA